MVVNKTPRDTLRTSLTTPPNNNYHCEIVRYMKYREPSTVIPFDSTAFIYSCQNNTSALRFENSGEASSAADLRDSTLCWICDYDGTTTTTCSGKLGTVTCLDDSFQNAEFGEMRVKKSDILKGFRACRR